MISTGGNKKKVVTRQTNDMVIFNFVSSQEQYIFKKCSCYFSGIPFAL